LRAKWNLLWHARYGGDDQHAAADAVCGKMLADVFNKRVH
jgi:hypothetical protein